MTIDIPGLLSSPDAGVGGEVEDDQELYDERDQERVLGLALARGDLPALTKILESAAKTEEGQQFILEHQINTAKIADALGGIIFCLLLYKGLVSITVYLSYYPQL